jgi:hypothetical protein
VLYSPFTRQPTDIAAHVKIVLDGLGVGPHYNYLAIANTLGLLHSNPPPGVKLWPVFCEVHRANMAKMIDGVIRSEGGKILKPEGWQPANVKQVLEEQGVAC